jgi:hypothetical protein
MTSKEFVRITEFYKKHYNLAMRGHVWLFPHTVNEMPCPSHNAKIQAGLSKAIYLKPKMMRITGNYFRIQDPYNGVMNIHRKWVQSVLLKHYNH